MTLPPERDSSGRFVKPESDEPMQPSDENMHPMSKLLFGWVEAPRTPFLLLVIVVAISAVLIVADLAINRHDYLDFANATGFYAFWGFAAFAIAVLSGWPLGKLLRRDEDYYGEADTKPNDVESDS
ncbi:MAG: hypothetical protein VXW22_00855 [Pseudomonadota bacterium]|jgi:hypothetical protein|nr:hypothetical protein [Pseudomonadota bacterium]